MPALDPEAYRKAYPPHRTYAQWLRRQPLASLTRADRRRLEANDDWLRNHPAEADRLDALVGKFVTLKRDRTTAGGKLVPAGTRYFVTGHWLGELHGVPDGERYTIRLRLDWVS